MLCASRNCWRRSRHSSRRGSILIMTALLMTFIFALLAFAIDVGYMYVVRGELQNTADASALAGVANLYPLSDSVNVNSFYLEPDIDGARAEAQTFARFNGAGNLKGSAGREDDVSFTLDGNYANATHGDILIGRFDDPSMHSLSLIPDEVAPNTVQVTARLQDGHANGSISLFFARVLGITDADISATAAATVIHASLLPFATSKDKWESLQTGGDSDNYTYDGGVTSGVGDGIPEITIFPQTKWDGVGLPPGNFGGLSIGTDTASAADLRRQIDQGPNAAELSYHGSLTQGVMISGKTGINATVKDAFNGGWNTSDLRYYAGIIGHPRFLPIYVDVNGNGTNSQFQIVMFVGVRVVGANLTGKNKWITLQPIVESKNLMTLRLTR